MHYIHHVYLFLLLVDDEHPAGATEEEDEENVGEDSAEARERAPRVERPDGERDLGVRDQERVMSALKDWRTRVTRDRRLPAICVVSNSQFKDIARRAPTDLATLATLGEMRRWQVDEWGDEILAVVASVEVRRGQSEEGSGEGEGQGGGKRRRRR